MEDVKQVLEEGSFPLVEDIEGDYKPEPTDRQYDGVCRFSGSNGKDDCEKDEEKKGDWVWTASDNHAYER